MKGQRVLHSHQSDDWTTPDDLFAELDREFAFEMDCAATRTSAKMLPCISQEQDALSQHWSAFFHGHQRGLTDAYLRDAAPICWLNPPYSQCRAFMEKAAYEATQGCTVVCLVPARTDTRWFHDVVWDRAVHQPRPGVEVRFLKGRLKFGGSANGAPFPSMIVIFRPR